MGICHSTPPEGRAEQWWSRSFFSELHGEDYAKKEPQVEDKNLLSSIVHEPEPQGAAEAEAGMEPERYSEQDVHCPQTGGRAGEIGPSEKDGEPGVLLGNRTEATENQRQV